MRKTVIVSAARTPFGKFGGVLKEVKAAELGGIVMKEALQRAGVSGDDVEGNVMGMVVQYRLRADTFPSSCPSGGNALECAVRNTE